MSGPDQDRENEIFSEEVKKQDDLQTERDFLKDKSIGGPNALRPSDEFIEQNLGKDMKPSERTAAAVERTDKRMDQERAQAQHREGHDRAERRSARDIMHEQRDQSHKRGRGR